MLTYDQVKYSGALLGIAGLTLALLSQEGAQAQNPKPAAPAREAGATVDPKTIWPAGLEKLAGRYVFAQVASPGGFWLRAPGQQPRQIAVDDLPNAAQQKLRAAEIIISDLSLPSQVEASQRESPSKRGMIRFYAETAPGKLVVRNLPGIGGADENNDYTGPALFHLEHTSHSNPSVSGVLDTRLKQEMTWGAATLDYADFGADVISTAPLKENKSPKPTKPVKPRDPAPAEDDPNETPSPISNARILRSGVEIFAYVNWTEKTGDVEKLYHGCVRMVKESSRATPRPGDPNEVPTKGIGTAPAALKPIAK